MKVAESVQEFLSAGEAEQIDAWWRACNYLSAGMIYLHENPLLRLPLEPGHIKQRLLGHWGSDPGQSFIWVHLNRLIRKLDLKLQPFGLEIVLQSLDGVLHRHAKVEILALKLKLAVTEPAYIQKVIDQYGLVACLPLDSLDVATIRRSDGFKSLSSCAPSRIGET